MAAATVITFSDVQPKPIDWLWPNRIPVGKLCLFDGDPSTGKTTLTIDIAARVSTGKAWPDGTPNIRGDVLLLSAEDGVEDTIAPRLLAAGADLRRVHTLTQVPVKGADGATRMAPPSLPRDIPIIKRIILRHGVKLIVIDVLMAYLSGQVDSHRDQDVRRVLHELAMLADETGCAIVLVRHLNKAAGGNALYRGGGSIGIVGAARAAFLIARDPNDPDRRILAVTKSNLAAEPPALAYRLVDVPQYGCACVEWEPNPVEYTASDLLSTSSDNDSGASNEAASWLSGLLADGDLAASEVFREAEAAGFSKDQIKRAKARAGATTTKHGMTGGWVWSLRDERPKGAKEAGSNGPHASRPSRGVTRPSDDVEEDND